MRQKILAAVLLAGVAVALGWYFLWDGTQGSLVLYGNVEIRQVDVSFRVDGRIARGLVDEGDSRRPSCCAWSAATARKKWSRPVPPWPVPVPWPTMRPSI